jgi:hypothetical protein
MAVRITSTTEVEGEESKEPDHQNADPYPGPQIYPLISKTPKMEV